MCRIDRTEGAGIREENTSTASGGSRTRSKHLVCDFPGYHLAAHASQGLFQGLSQSSAFFFFLLFVAMPEKTFFLIPSPWLSRQTAAHQMHPKGSRKCMQYFCVTQGHNFSL